MRFAAITSRQIPTCSFCLTSRIVAQTCGTSRKSSTLKDLRPSASRVPRFAHFPFGGGPRQCIGNNFSMLEAQLLLATLAQHFQLELVSGAQVEPEPSVTLRPRSQVMVRLHARPRCFEAGASQAEGMVPTLTCPY